MQENCLYKVSVVVPVYKVEKWLPRCIESLCAQTLEELEIILVDDGSPDGSSQICDAYAKKDSRIRVIHKENGGVLRARQSGIEEAQAPYIGFVDGDDFAAPDMFLTLWREAEARKADVVCCSFVHYWNDEKQIVDTYGERMSGFYEGEKLADFYRRFFYDHTPRTENAHITPGIWNKLFKRELILKSHRKLADECSQIKVGEDMLVSYTCLLEAERISVLGSFAPLYYVYRQDSVMHSFKSYYLNNTELLLDQLSAMKMPPEAIGPVKEGIARFMSYTAVHLVLGVVPDDVSLIRKYRKTRQIVRHILRSPRWKSVMCERGDDLFEFGFEKLIYRLLLKGMGGSIAVLDVLHKHMEARKKNQ